MKKTISRIGCFLLAILLGLYSVAIPADADALSPGEWFVTGYYRVTSDGVMGYSYGYVMDGGAQEIESSLYAGQVVYARIAYSSMGVTWYSCSSEDEHGDGFNYVLVWLGGCFLLSTSWTRTRTRAGNRSTNGSPDNSRYNNNYYNHHNDHDHNHNSYFYNCNYSFYYDRTNYDNNTSNCTSQSQAKFSFYF